MSRSSVLEAKLTTGNLTEIAVPDIEPDVFNALLQ